MRLWLGRGLIAVAIVLLGFWVWVAVDSRQFQADLARRLASRRPGPPPRHLAAATRREASSSGLVGRIEIPRLKLSVMVVEGTTDRALLHGVGHLEHTAFPGEVGNVTLAGHRDTYFRRLKAIARGDTIRLRTPDGSFAYHVDSVLIVRPDRTDLLDPTPDPTLTLVTCYPFHWIGPAPDRFIVRATEVRTRPSRDGQHAWNRPAWSSERPAAEKRLARRPRPLPLVRSRVPAPSYATSLRWS